MNFVEEKNTKKTLITLAVIVVVMLLAGCTSEEIWTANTFVVVEGTVPTISGVDSSTTIEIGFQIDTLGRHPSMGDFVPSHIPHRAAVIYARQGESFEKTATDGSTSFAFAEGSYILWGVIDVDNDNRISSGDYYYPYENDQMETVDFTIDSNEETRFQIDNSRFGIVP